MRRRTRPLIAFTTAYGMMLSAVFGAISSGQSAATGASSYCRASSPSGDQAPVLPARHDLDCCIACGSSSPALPVSAAGISLPSLPLMIWAADEADFFCLPADARPSARAPPVRI